MGKAVKILVVDDEIAVRSAIASLLEAEGFEAITFASADECLRSGCVAEASCIILDVRMPGTSGLQMQRQLQASGEGIPIIFISAHGDSGTRTQAMSAGASAFLAKPFVTEELLGAVHAAVQQG